MSDQADATTVDVDVDDGEIERAILDAGGTPKLMAPYVEQQLRQRRRNTPDATAADVLTEMRADPSLWPAFGDQRPRRSRMSISEKVQTIRRVGIDAYLELER